MVPLGTKAIIYKNSDTRSSWAPHGLDAWLLGPSKDHYRCHLYFVPKTNSYCFLGSNDLFPQHCIAPPIHTRPTSTSYRKSKRKL